ncbi:Ger(x)C family spore germination protein [Bacillus sp. 31A1R]|uniref:Ger(X)C family spore germination protein n=1 Tax=Robertmurraya mangrovi TaxID=3098077 RepID=A0ABU5IWQ9_9BACI|nr:Ger(x)C family spore germination protein [Bacillus sp. 31A1R]MDZ5471584.1 Ger(x)C family spore germination protein [Bacillus sp. 31A1R]
MKKTLLFFLLFSFVILSGCSDKIEIEEEGFVLVIGLDKPSVGEKGIDITFQIANPSAGRAGEDNNANEVETITLTAPDPFSARDMTNSSETRNINFYHTKAIVISEELAKSNDFFHIMSSMMRERQIRRDMHVLISKEKASEYLRNNKPSFEASPHKFYDFMSRRWKRNALVPNSTMHDFLRATSADAGLALAIYTTATSEEPKDTEDEDNFLPGEINKRGGSDIQIIGAAVFKEGKMIGTMTGEEVRVALILQKEMRPERLIFTYDDPINPDFRITGKATNVRTDVSIDVHQEYPVIKVKQWFDIKVLAIPSLIDYVENLSNQSKLKDYFERKYYEHASKLIERTQKEFKAEPFNWSNQARKKFWTLTEYEDYDWMKSYPNAEIKIEVDVTLTEFGKKLSPRDISEIKD